MKTVIKVNSRALGKKLFRNGFADSDRASSYKGHAIVIESINRGNKLYSLNETFGFSHSLVHDCTEIPRSSRLFLTGLQDEGWFVHYVQTDPQDLLGNLLAIGDQPASITVQNAASLVRRMRKPQNKHVN